MAASEDFGEGAGRAIFPGGGEGSQLATAGTGRSTGGRVATGQGLLGAPGVPKGIVPADIPYSFTLQRLLLCSFVLSFFLPFFILQNVDYFTFHI